MMNHQAKVGSRVLTIPVLLAVGMLLMVGGALAPLALVTQASTAVLQQVVPTPSVVPPGVEPAPTEEPSPSPTPDDVFHLGTDTATMTPIETDSDDDVIQVDDDPDNVTGIVYGPSPTPNAEEPTPFPEEESETDESSVRVIVRWCPFGTELGGPRIDHPLIEKLCTLDGPDIRVDLVPTTEFDKPRNAIAMQPFPSTIEFTPLTPGMWRLQTEFRESFFIQAVFCRVVEPGTQFEQVFPPRTQDPVFEINVGEGENWECIWTWVLPGEGDGDNSNQLISVFKFNCADTYGRNESPRFYEENCTEAPTGVEFTIELDDAVVFSKFTEPHFQVMLSNGEVVIQEKIPEGYGEPVVFCRWGNSPKSFVQDTVDGAITLSASGAIETRCFWFNIPLEIEEHPETTGFSATVETTTHACKGTPPRDANYGWFNKNCVAFSGPSLELNNGEKDGNVQLQPAGSPPGYAVNKNIAPGSYLLTAAGGGPLNAYSVWCAALKPDQMPSPSDFVQVPISRAGVSIVVQEETWTSCKVFGPATRGSVESNNRFPVATILRNQ